MNRLPNQRATWTWAIALSFAWLFALVCFSLPGRAGPDGVGSLDVVALIKVAIRFAAFAALGMALWSQRRQPHFLVIATCLAPLGVFAAWAIVSTLWSPLKAVSIGQVIGFVDLCLLAGCVAASWRREDDTSRVMMHLNLALLAFSVVILAVHAVSADLSGLNREEWTEEGSSGLVHPTTAGATSSLGLVLLVNAWSLYGWRWSNRLLVPGSLVHALVVLISASRMALLMAAATLFYLFVARANLRQKGFAVLAAAFAGVALVVIDPGMEAAHTVIDKALEKFSRGESSEQMQGLNGRSDLWEAIWQSYGDSPLIGHGYFVTSATGEIDVWSGPANRTAHNVTLQVLVTTGLVGCVLWIVGLAYPVWVLWRSRASSPAAARLAQFLAVVGLWFLGWAQLSESFMGPVQPESVVFFSLLGLAVAHADAAIVLRDRALLLGQPAALEASP